MILTEEVNSLVILKALSLLGAPADAEYRVNAHAANVDIIHGGAGQILGYVDRRVSSVTEIKVGKLVADRAWDLKVSQEPPA